MFQVNNKDADTDSTDIHSVVNLNKFSTVV